MKYILILAFLFPAGLYAQKAQSQTQEDICAEVGELAENIMLIRQAGTVMSEVIAKMTSVGGPQAVEDLSIAMIKEAYNSPQYSVEENRIEAAIRFRNANELACYQVN